MMSAVPVSEARPSVGAPFKIQLFDAPLGAELLGLDLTLPLDDSDFSRVHQAHLDHHLLVFRDQKITPAQQIEFSRRFGALQIHVLHLSLIHI